MRSEKIVNVRDCVALVYDVQSPVNERAAVAEMLKDARIRSKNAREFVDAWKKGLRPLVEAGMVVYWLTIFASVFKIRAEVHAPGELDLRTNDSFVGGVRGQLGILHAVSGRIIVSSLQDLAENIGEDFLQIDRGKYLVGLENDPDAEASHEFLDSILEYPPDEGPDWTVHLWPMS